MQQPQIVTKGMSLRAIKADFERLNSSHTKLRARADLARKATNQTEALFALGNDPSGTLPAQVRNGDPLAKYRLLSPDKIRRSHREASMKLGGAALADIVGGRLRAALADRFGCGCRFDPSPSVGTTRETSALGTEPADLDADRDIPAEPPRRRPICAGCDRPPRVCVCDALPRPPLALDTPVIIWQHPNEAKRRVATASLPRRLLGPCTRAQTRPPSRANLRLRARMRGAGSDGHPPARRPPSRSSSRTITTRT